MKSFYHRFFRYTIIRMLSQFLFVGVTTTCLISNGVVLSSKADAQSPPPVNPNELTSYARALLGMEPQRQQAFEEIKKIIGDKEVPKIVCNDTNSLNGLPSKARDIAVNYCKRSQKIVEDNDLTIDRFNKITIDIQNNENLKRQLYNRLLLLQKNPNAR